MKTSIMTTVLAVLSVLLRLEVAQADLVNVALGKPTQQIDTYSVTDHDAHSANDGDLTQVSDNGGCTHSISRTNTWWMVDLLQAYDIYTIRILNRVTFSDRLQGFYIYVSMDNPLPIPGPDHNFVGQICLSHPAALSNRGLQTLNCIQPVKGRFVYLWKPEFDYLTLCEFQVLANDKGQSACTISHGQKSLLTPVYSTNLQPVRSLAQCVYTCQSVPERQSNLIQFNKRSGKCECVRYNNLVDDSPGISPDQDFDVCQVDERMPSV